MGNHVSRSTNYRHHKVDKNAVRFNVYISLCLKLKIIEKPFKFVRLSIILHATTVLRMQLLEFSYDEQQEEIRKSGGKNHPKKVSENFTVGVAHGWMDLGPRSVINVT